VGGRSSAWEKGVALLKKEGKEVVMGKGVRTDKKRHMWGSYQWGKGALEGRGDL